MTVFKCCFGKKMTEANKKTLLEKDFDVTNLLQVEFCSHNAE